MIDRVQLFLQSKKPFDINEMQFSDIPFDRKDSGLTSFLSKNDIGIRNLREDLLLDLNNFSFNDDPLHDIIFTVKDLLEKNFAKNAQRNNIIRNLFATLGRKNAEQKSSIFS